MSGSTRRTALVALVVIELPGSTCQARRCPDGGRKVPSTTLFALDRSCVTCSTSCWSNVVFQREKRTHDWTRTGENNVITDTDTLLGATNYRYFPSGQALHSLVSIPAAYFPAGHSVVTVDVVVAAADVGATVVNASAVFSWSVEHNRWQPEAIAKAAWSTIVVQL